MKTIVLRLVLLMFACLVGARTSLAQTIQRKGEIDLPVIHAQRGFSTLIEFPAKQKIVEVTCGDKDFWVVEGTGRFLHVKPAKEGIVTNLNVLMEGDIVYAFILREVTRNGVAKETADLRVSIDPGEDPTKLRTALDAAEKDNAALKNSVVQSQQALTDLTKKFETEKQKNDKIIAQAPSGTGSITISSCPPSFKECVPAGYAMASRPVNEKPLAQATPVNGSVSIVRECSPSIPGDCAAAAVTVPQPRNPPTRLGPRIFRRPDGSPLN